MDRYNVVAACRPRYEPDLEFRIEDKESGLLIAVCWDRERAEQIAAVFNAGERSDIQGKS